MQEFPDTVSVLTKPMPFESTSYAVLITKQHVHLQFICFDFAFAKGTYSIATSPKV